MSIEHTDRESAKNATAPRVALADIEAAIRQRHDTTADQALVNIPAAQHSASLPLLSICILEMRNGFVIIGKSAPASPENFNAELGRKFAYEDAVRQLWPLMGYALKQKLADGA